MACSFCVQNLNEAVGGMNGVDDVNVALAPEEVLIRYDDASVSRLELEETLWELGYRIRDPDKQRHYEEQQAELDQGAACSRAGREETGAPDEARPEPEHRHFVFEVPDMRCEHCEEMIREALQQQGGNVGGTVVSKKARPSF